MLQADDRFLLREEFQRGIGALREFDLTYDLLVYPRQLPAAIALVQSFPDQPFVLDHIAKPPIKDGATSPWREQIRELATRPNVMCKVSGRSYIQPSIAGRPAGTTKCVTPVATK